MGVSQPVCVCVCAWISEADIFSPRKLIMYVSKVVGRVNNWGGSKEEGTEGKLRWRGRIGEEVQTFLSIRMSWSDNKQNKYSNRNNHHGSGCAVQRSLHQWGIYGSVVDVELCYMWECPAGSQWRQQGSSPARRSIERHESDSRRPKLSCPPAHFCGLASPWNRNLSHKEQKQVWGS